MALSKPLNKYFDHTILKADASASQVEVLCQEALKYDFFSVCVNSCNVALANEILKGSDVKIAAVVGFPLGACTTATKAFETEECCRDGVISLAVQSPSGNGKNPSCIGISFGCLTGAIEQKRQIILKFYLFIENRIPYREAEIVVSIIVFK